MKTRSSLTAWPDEPPEGGVLYTPRPLEDGYLAHDWTDVRRTLEDIYDGPSALSRHSKQEFLNFVRLSSKPCMNTEEDVLYYYCIAVPRPQQTPIRLTRLIAGKPNKAFWHGFHSI